MKKVLTWLLLCILLLQLCPASLADTAIPAKAKTQFNIRTEASTDADRVANVPLGATVNILSYEEDGVWCRVQYRSKEGYAKVEWLRVQGGAVTLPTTNNSAAEGSGLSVGASEDGERLWLCMTRVKFTIREQPDDNARRLRQIKKGAELYCLAWGDDWCLVQTKDGKVTGYAKAKWLFHFQSYNSFENGVPGYEEIRPTGYVVMKADMTISDAKKSYGGNKLNAGDIIFVQKQDDGRLLAQIYRDWDEIPADMCDYYPLTNWREAKAGDMIGGYTQYFGRNQGYVLAPKRKHNIKLAMGFMNGTVMPKGEEYSFLGNIGPTTSGRGYVVAGVTGGSGSGIGGGVCHTSTLMYEAALSLPFLITEREPHTDDGTTYAPLEFDATVGAYSDLKFINTLPYDVKMHTYMNKKAGVITVQFECMETVDAETLANWNNDSWQK